ncbi:MAG: lysophospholipid acyltransferase family protein [Planctomycetota bacterium]
MDTPEATRFYLAIRWLARQACRLYFRNRRRGIDNVPKEGGVLVAANHASFLDPVLVGVTTARPLRFVARRSLFRNPLFGWLIRNLNSVPINRAGVSKETLRVVLEQLRLGRAVLIFPEGTRSPDGRLGEFRSGVVRLAQMGNVPVVPALVFGSYAAWGRKRRLPRPSRTAVAFCEPLTFERKADADEAVKLLKESLERLAQEYVEQQGRELLPEGYSERPENAQETGDRVANDVTTES